MSKNPDEPDNSDVTTPRDYEVGYGRTPLHTRFKHGQIANPNGRKGKSKPACKLGTMSEMGEMFEEEGKRKIKPNHGKPMTADKAVVRATYNSAIQTNRHARDAIFKERREHEERVRAEKEDDIRFVLWLKDHQEKRMASEKCPRKRRLIFPHPRDIYLNPRTGEYDITGPLNRDELRLFKGARGEIVEWRRRIAVLEKLLFKVARPEILQEEIDRLAGDRKRWEKSLGHLTIAGRPLFRSCPRVQFGDAGKEHFGEGSQRVQRVQRYG
jgi:hypothetical protein